MATKKIDDNNLIHFEIEKLERKVNEFQKYLELNSIIHGKKRNPIDDDTFTQDEQDKLHKEIIVQIKMQDALFGWLPLLERLREKEENKALQTRGDVEVNGLFNKRDNDNK